MINPEDFYDEILENSPSQATIFLVLSRMKGEGHLERVIERCRRALDAYPDDISIRKLLAEAYVESGMISEAEKELERVSQQLDSFASIYRLKAQVFTEQGRNDEAAKALELYLSHNPDDEEAVALLQGLAPEEEPGAEKDLSPEEGPLEGLEEGEEEPDIATPTLAEVYFNQGEIQEAISVYEKVLEREPEDQFSQHRLEQLKSMLEGEPPPPEREPAREKAPDIHRKRKERLVTILQSWLSSMREMARAYPGS
ncbi:MAG: tetratricopeptide repeat protein [Deltaproteobacteria bacterium]|nr:tetratricopeptide repeat protein [Deltaproteobacteria bacterium]